MLEGVTSTPAIAGAAYPVLSVSGLWSGKVTLPVRPAYILFANFKHIQVVPDSRIENGVPLYKLSILDRLLDLMAKTGSARAQARAAGSDSIDTLIEGISWELRARREPSFTSGTLPEPGMVVDLVA
jgi:hypothetical protein